MDGKRKRQQDEREREQKALEDCVLNILIHGDPNQLTESKVRKLAASETGFDLANPANRKIVKETVETYFTKQKQDESNNEKKAQAKAVRDKGVSLASPKPERRRKLVTFDDDSEEENAEPATRVSRANVTNQDDAEGDNIPESEEDNGKRSSKATTKKRADDTEGDEESERVNRKKHAVPSAARRRHSNSDEEESDAEEEEEKRTNGKSAASVRSKQGRKAYDEDEESEEREKRGPKALPERKKTSNDDDTVCQLSKNRFVSVQDFKGRPLVSIREYYEKDGKQLPTRKGISLTVDQWEAIKDGIPDIDDAIQQLLK